MENNIFFKNKKETEKFNPDVISNLSKKNGERKKIEFKASPTVYNAITNIVPKDVKSPKDLLLNSNEPFDDIKKLINQKKIERSRQDFDLKPQRIKALPDNLIVDKHIENFDELKNNSEIHMKNTINTMTEQKSKYNDIMLNLKRLGILNKNK
jgi:hypothetical protein